MSKAEEARMFHQNGANCAQSVLCAFSRETGLSLETCMRLASGFGGGIAKTRETCGAVTGMVMAYDLIRGGSPDQTAVLQKMIAAFKEKTGSVTCRILLGLEKAPEGVAVQKLPCRDMVALAADILEQELSEKNA